MNDSIFKDRLTQLHNQCFEGEPIFVFPNSYITILGSNNYKSYILVRKLGKGKYQLYNACTAKNERNKGNMKTLIRRTLEDIKSHENTSIVLVTIETYSNNTHALRLYQSLGFCPIGITKLEGDNRLKLTLQTII